MSCLAEFHGSLTVFQSPRHHFSPHPRAAVCMLSLLAITAGTPQWLSGKESACSAEDAGSILGSGKSPPVFLPGKFHGPRRLAGYSPRVCKESDTTEHAHTLTHSCASLRLSETSDLSWQLLLQGSSLIFWSKPNLPILSFHDISAQPPSEQHSHNLALYLQVILLIISPQLKHSPVWARISSVFTHNELHPLLLA